MPHPIEGLMTTAMQSIKDMVDVNTIVGDAVQAPDGTIIIPISRVSFGFAAGGGEYSKCCNDTGTQQSDMQMTGRFPFAGGSGAGVSINPVAFMVVGKEQIRLMPIGMNTSIERIIDMIPDLIKKTEESIKKRIKIRREVKTDTEKDEPTE
jgi:sporulation protein YtfJ